jgi:bifunctional DNA-binding transcriptional regulator/antitoxin component of YhaV-PrlF toxin-antitoxin module
MHREKFLGDSGILKGRGVTIPNGVREKLGVKEGDFLTCLETRSGYAKIKEFEFDWNEAVKQIETLEKEKLLLS